MKLSKAKSILFSLKTVGAKKGLSFIPKSEYRRAKKFYTQLSHKQKAKFNVE